MAKIVSESGFQKIDVQGATSSFEQVTVNDKYPLIRFPIIIAVPEMLHDF